MAQQHHGWRLGPGVDQCLRWVSDPHSEGPSSQPCYYKPAFQIRQGAAIAFQRLQTAAALAAEYRKKFSAPEGVLFIGKAREKTSVFRTERRRHEQTGATYPWLVRSTAMVNHFYVYCMDRDFGPFFLKFCTYFPYNAKLCLNGHEYVKRQLTNRSIPYEVLDNGILSCDDPKRMQALCDGLSDEKIDGLLRKWFRKLPHPFSAKDRQAGYRYQISILQAEFSLTQVLDRPLTGRILDRKSVV